MLRTALASLQSTDAACRDKAGEYLAAELEQRSIEMCKELVRCASGCQGEKEVVRLQAAILVGSDGMRQAATGWGDEVIREVAGMVWAAADTSATSLQVRRMLCRVLATTLRPASFCLSFDTSTSALLLAEAPDLARPDPVSRQQLDGFFSRLLAANTFGSDTVKVYATAASAVAATNPAALPEGVLRDIVGRVFSSTAPPEAFACVAAAAGVIPRDLMESVVAPAIVDPGSPLHVSAVGAAAVPALCKVLHSVDGVVVTLLACNGYVDDAASAWSECGCCPNTFAPQQLAKHPQLVNAITAAFDVPALASALACCRPLLLDEVSSLLLRGVDVQSVADCLEAAIDAASFDPPQQYYLAASRLLQQFQLCSAPVLVKLCRELDSTEAAKLVVDYTAQLLPYGPGLKIIAALGCQACWLPQELREQLAASLFRTPHDIPAGLDCAGTIIFCSDQEGDEATSAPLLAAAAPVATASFNGDPPAAAAAFSFVSAVLTTRGDDPAVQQLLRIALDAGATVLVAADTSSVKTEDRDVEVAVFRLLGDAACGVPPHVLAPHMEGAVRAASTFCHHLYPPLAVAALLCAERLCRCLQLPQHHLTLFVNIVADILTHRTVALSAAGLADALLPLLPAGNPHRSILERGSSGIRSN